jgi:hypothetical protein
MNKKGDVSKEQFVHIGLFILVVGGILVATTPLLSGVKGLLLDIGVDIPVNDIETQAEAKEVINGKFVPALFDCRDSKNTSCLCDLGEFAKESLPNGYALSFSLDGSSFMVSLSNEQGGELSKKWISSMKPCVYDENLVVDDLTNVANGPATILIGESSMLSYENTKGDNFEYSVNNDNFVYKKDEGTFCIVGVGFPAKPVCE